MAPVAVSTQKDFRKSRLLFVLPVPQQLSLIRAAGSQTLTASPFSAPGSCAYGASPGSRELGDPGYPKNAIQAPTSSLSAILNEIGAIDQ